MNLTATPATSRKAARCPECHSFAELYTGGKFAGMWACTNTDCMASDSCDHLTSHPERVDMLKYNPAHHTFENVEVVLNICDLCEQTIDEEIF